MATEGATPGCFEGNADEGKNRRRILLLVMDECLSRNGNGRGKGPFSSIVEHCSQ